MPKIDWIGVPEALEILKQNNHRDIHPNYLSYLGRNGRIARKQVDKRTYLYSKQDAEKIHLIRRAGAGRTPKTEKIPVVKPEAA